jgi:hypothetical protein
MNLSNEESTVANPNVDSNTEDLNIADSNDVNPTVVDCPVVEAIKIIRGGFYSTETGFDDNNLIKLGGMERVCDNTSFYIMHRRLEFARFKLSKPDFQACLDKGAMFSRVAGLMYVQVYISLANELFKYLYDQFIFMVDAIGEMEKFLALRIQIAAKSGTPLNLSLPDIIFMPHTDISILYFPHILTLTVNRVIKYINDININAIINEPLHDKIELLPAYTGPGIWAQDFQIPSITGDTSESIIASMEEVLKHEMIIAEILLNIEKYHCSAINHMGKIIDKCKKIMSAVII